MTKSFRADLRGSSPGLGPLKDGSNLGAALQSAQRNYTEPARRPLQHRLRRLGAGIGRPTGGLTRLGAPVISFT